MNIFDIGVLNRTVDSLIRPRSFFLDNFFTQVETSETDKVYFDVELDGQRRRLSPFVHPLVEGKIVETLGYQTQSFTPAYVKDKRVFDATKNFRRTIGEAIGTGQALTPAQRQNANLIRNQADQVEMLTRRMEIMAIEALRTGKETVEMQYPDGTTKTFVVDFKRHASLTQTLTTGTKWGDTGVVPTADIREMQMNVLRRSGVSVRTVVMEPDAWEKFFASENLQKVLDLRRVDTGEIKPELAPVNSQYMGAYGGTDYWVYTDFYIDPVDNTEKPVLPSGTVLGVGDIMGVRHFGAIKDEEAGYQSREYFSKSWVQPDPSVRFLLMQSAPLIVPYRPNASFALNVL